jgi:hypothetical protein
MSGAPSDASGSMQDMAPPGPQSGYGNQLRSAILGRHCPWRGKRARMPVPKGYGVSVIVRIVISP